MVARFIQLGEPATPAERAALRFLVDGLPANYTVYGNPWLVERSGVVYELDAVVVAPHAIFVVEIKSYRGTIEGTDYDWFTPEPVKSPIGLNRKTAQVLNSLMKRSSYEAGQIWVQGLVFLSVSNHCNVRGAASRDRIHTRATILAALQESAFIDRIASRALTPNTPRTTAELDRILTSEESAPKKARPARRIREYEIIEALETHDNCKELRARHNLTGDERVLRIYAIPPLATDEERDRIHRRARWEAQVLGRLGDCKGILVADPPFTDEAGIVLPLEHFRGVTLATWCERYALTKKANLEARVNVWLEIAAAIQAAHREGVVHRLLRPEVILVEDTPKANAIRVTGFDLAKQLIRNQPADSTALFTTLGDDRLRYAAPEVINGFSDAEPRSDQFSLGALLALLVAGRPLFDSTRELMGARRVMVHLRDIASGIKLTLDEAVARMLSLRAADRFPTLADADAAVRSVFRDPVTATLPNVAPIQSLKFDELPTGQRIGTDYEILDRLGQGGMAVVYAARHLPSGRTRALKISRPEAAAEDALRGEFQELSKLDHPGIVRVLDLSNMVERHLTLVMERVGGETLRKRLAAPERPDAATRRRYAEDLLGALHYLEQKGVIHKDLKPDNLLVGEGGLTVIDFSLASMPASAPFGGTALYRDPARPDWSHASDRYAAALCLFELYAGRHAFDGRAPEPGESPSIRDEDVEPAGLANFFRRAFDRNPEQRFASALAMRDAFLLALGAHVDVETPGTVERLESASPLRAAPLPPRAINQLGRAGIQTIGELLALSDAQVRSLDNIGEKTAADVIAFQAKLRAQGLVATSAPTHVEPPLVPELVTNAESIERLGLPQPIRNALVAANVATIGVLARMPRSQLRAINGIGNSSLARIVAALHRMRDRDGAPAAPASTLEDFWQRAIAPLSDRQHQIVDRFIGVTQEPEVQGDIATDLALDQSTVSTDFTRGLKAIDDGALAEVTEAVEQMVDGLGGIAVLADVGERVEEQWVPGAVSGAGMVRLLARVNGTRLQAFTVDGVDGLVLARPGFDKGAVRGFVGEVRRFARQWPPVEGTSTRRALAATLPEYGGDPLQLATRLCDDVDLTEGGHLVHTPVEPSLSIPFVLDRAREELSVADLAARVRQVFGEHTPVPEAGALLDVLRDLGYRVHEERVVRIDAVPSATLRAPNAPLADQLPPLLGADRPPEVALRDLLRDAAGSRGFRLLITPPEKHADIGRSVGAALGGTFVSFEDAFFRRHGGDIAALERAEQYEAQRIILTEYAEEVLDALVEEYGESGRVIVLGDTALLGLCNILDTPRRLYDQTLSGSHGFWVLVVPGVIHNRQPRFNEGPPIWHLEGVTFPLNSSMPVLESR